MAGCSALAHQWLLQQGVDALPCAAVYTAAKKRVRERGSILQRQVCTGLMYLHVLCVVSAGHVQPVMCAVQLPAIIDVVVALMSAVDM